MEVRFIDKPTVQYILREIRKVATKWNVVVEHDGQGMYTVKTTSSNLAGEGKTVFVALKGRHDYLTRWHPKLLERFDATYVAE